jgi:hypothetical protein
MYFNSGLFQQTLRVTPAMLAEITRHVWSVEEGIGLAQEAEVEGAMPWLNEFRHHAAMYWFSTPKASPRMRLGSSPKMGSSIFTAQRT